MAGSQKQNCKFFLLRYVANAISNEFVNIGLVLLPPQAAPEFRLAKNWSRVQAVDPQADVELLQAFGDELRAQLGNDKDRDLTLKKIEDWLSNTLQATEYKACITDSPVQEADELARLYLDGPRRRAIREQGAREISRRMDKELQRVGIWETIPKKIPVSQYTGSGDPLKIDCGYRVGETFKMFHATPVRNDVRSAKALAFTCPGLVEGIRKSQGAQLNLTAIVEDGLDRADQTVNFALEVLESQNIQIAPIAEFPQIAETAAREIRAT